MRCIVYRRYPVSRKLEWWAGRQSKLWCIETQKQVACKDSYYKVSHVTDRAEEEFGDFEEGSVGWIGEFSEPWLKWRELEDFPQSSPSLRLNIFVIYAGFAEEECEK